MAPVARIRRQAPPSRGRSGPSASPGGRSRRSTRSHRHGSAMGSERTMYGRKRMRSGRIPARRCSGTRSPRRMTRMRSKSRQVDSVHRSRTFVGGEQGVEEDQPGARADEPEKPTGDHRLEAGVGDDHGLTVRPAQATSRPDRRCTSRRRQPVDPKSDRRARASSQAGNADGSGGRSKAVVDRSTGRLANVGGPGLAMTAHSRRGDRSAQRIIGRGIRALTSDPCHSPHRVPCAISACATPGRSRNESFGPLLPHAAWWEVSRQRQQRPPTSAVRPGIGFEMALVQRQPTREWPQ